MRATHANKAMSAASNAKKRGPEGPRFLVRKVERLLRHAAGCVAGPTLCALRHRLNAQATIEATVDDVGVEIADAVGWRAAGDDT